MKIIVSLLIFLYCYALSGQQKDVIVRDIIIEGNKKTHDRIIRRELNIEIGMLIEAHLKDSILALQKMRIYNTNLFNVVDYEISNCKNDSCDVNFKLQERWYIFPFPTIRLADRNFNDWWVNRNGDLRRVNFGLNIFHFNFRGRAEKLKFNVAFGFQSTVKMSYHIPYIDAKQKHGLIFNFSYAESVNAGYKTENNIVQFLSSDNILQKSSFSSIGWNYRQKFYSNHSVFFSYNTHLVDPAIINENADFFGEERLSQKYFQLAYRYLWDARDNRNYPLRGTYWSVGLGKFGVKIIGDVDFWLMNGIFIKFSEISKRFFLGNLIRATISSQNNRNYANYTALGYGQNIVRGFELNVIEGNSFFIQKNELKYELIKKMFNLGKIMPIKYLKTFPLSIYPKVFFDNGYVNGFKEYEGSALLDNQWVYSYGVGIDIITYHDVLLRWEFSRNSSQETHFFFSTKISLK